MLATCQVCVQAFLGSVSVDQLVLSLAERKPRVPKCAEDQHLRARRLVASFLARIHLEFQQTSKTNHWSKPQRFGQQCKQRSDFASLL